MGYSALSIRKVLLAQIAFYDTAPLHNHQNFSSALRGLQDINHAHCPVRAGARGSEHSAENVQTQLEQIENEICCISGACRDGDGMRTVGVHMGQRPASRKSCAVGAWLLLCCKWSRRMQSTAHGQKPVNCSSAPCQPLEG